MDTPPRPYRIQFTVRTFFVAAVLISMFAIATKLPTLETKVTAIVFLAWLTLAGVYWLFHATGSLVALPVGAVVCAVLWGLTLLFSQPNTHRTRTLLNC